MTPRPAYEDQAPYYDLAYGGVDYAGDVRFLHAAFERYGVAPVARLLDLGCGTGTHALLLALEGVDVVGLDLSENLLRVAREKAAAAPADVTKRLRFERGDMATDIPAGPFDAVISLFGSFNYVTDDARAVGMFRRIRENLRPGGLVIFEFWNPVGFEPRRHWSRTETPEGTDFYYLAGGTFDAEAALYHIDFEGLHLEGDRLIDRFQERHTLRLRTPATVQGLLAEAGLEPVAFTNGEVGAKSLDAPAEDALRIMAIARKG